MEGNSSTSSSGSNTMLPPGFRFHPTDEELLTCYLIGKVTHPDLMGAASSLVDVDLNKCEPWDLPGKAKIGEKEWYFFSHRDRKYPTGVRTNRATKSGYWKTTGKDKDIFNSITSELIGMKKTLVFYQGRAPRGEKTNWVMHEFRLHSKPTFPSAKEEWVICRVFQKSGTPKKYNSSYGLGIGAFSKDSESSTVLGSSSLWGLDMITNREAAIPAVKVPQTPSSSNAAPSILATGPLGAQMDYVEGPNNAINVQTIGQSGYENSVDLHAYWTSFLLN